MRVLTIDTPSVHEFGYFENGILKCTSWGVTETRIEQVPADYTTPDGLEVTINMQPLVTRGKPMMAIQYKDHNALVDRQRFVDVIVDPGIRLAIASSKGDLIATLNAPDPALLTSIIARPRNGMDERNLFAVAQADELDGHRHPVTGRNAGQPATRADAAAANRGLHRILHRRAGGVALQEAPVALGRIGDRGAEPRIHRPLSADRRTQDRQVDRRRGAGALASSRRFDRRGPTCSFRWPRKAD